MTGIQLKLELTVDKVFPKSTIDARGKLILLNFEKKLPKSFKILMNSK